jgi:transcriptional regulator with XRE-family HTH domain
MMDIILMAPAEVATMLGARLRDRRLALGLTQDELAKRAGLGIGTVKNLEARTGTCSLDTLLRASLALGLAEHFESLFAVRPKSIADMERSAQPPRQRARRSRLP